MTDIGQERRSANGCVRLLPSIRGTDSGHFMARRQVVDRHPTSKGDLDAFDAGARNITPRYSLKHQLEQDLVIPALEYYASLFTHITN